MTPELLATPIVDTHVILRRGNEILLSQRGGRTGYGYWHLPAGKLNAGEPVTAGAARELLEETGVAVAPELLRLVHVVHYRADNDTTRIGFFFAASRWTGTPVNREPDKCLGLGFFGIGTLPSPLHEYPAAGLHGYLAAEGALSLRGW